MGRSWTFPKAVERGSRSERRRIVHRVVDAVTEGVNGGFIDPAQICYFVARSLPTTTPLFPTVFATSVTDSPRRNEHTTMAYLVVAVSREAVRLGYFNVIAMGTPTSSIMPIVRRYPHTNGPWTRCQRGDAEGPMSRCFNPFTRAPRTRTPVRMIAFVPSARATKDCALLGKFNIAAP